MVPPLTIKIALEVAPNIRLTTNDYKISDEFIKKLLLHR